MMFVLMAVLMVAAITLSAFQFINADIVGGVRTLQATQVYNVAQSGVHYAIGKMMLGTADTYTGEALPIMNGAQTVGTATITVSCIASGGPPPCATYPDFRRIISVGTLPIPGPTRKIVAVVQSTSGGGPGYGLCALNTLWVQQDPNPAENHDVFTIYADIASQGAITLDDNSLNQATFIVNKDPNVIPAFTGKV